MDKRAQVADLIAKRKAAADALNAMVDGASAETRSLTDAESATFDAGEADVRALDARIAELDSQIRADDAAAEMARKYAGARIQVVEPEIYRSGPGGESYFRDLWLAQKNGDMQARDRLTRNATARQAEQRALSTVNGRR